MIVALCPGGTVTGGPEALHQLVDSAVRQGIDAAICYEPHGDTPVAYRHYRCPVVAENQIPPRSLVVVPELWAHEARRFSHSTTALWWLSVDNAPAGAHEIACGVHLAQSEYARLHLEERGHIPLMLGDYTTTVFSDHGSTRRWAVAYNPTKGNDLAAKFAEENPEVEMVPISKMTTGEIVDLLNGVEVYVDFGHHPGKDRLPREAAACGAVVFVRDAGAASNDVDVPIPSEFKFRDVGALSVLVDSVQYRAAHQRQDGYRRTIRAERDTFDTQVRALAAWHQSL